MTKHENADNRNCKVKEKNMRINKQQAKNNKSC